MIIAAMLILGIFCGCESKKSADCEGDMTVNSAND